MAVKCMDRGKEKERERRERESLSFVRDFNVMGVSGETDEKLFRSGLAETE